MHPEATSLRLPTLRLLAGLVFMLVVIGIFAGFTLHAVSQMRSMQQGMVERNRLASLQLIRIQSDLNALGLFLRDIAEAEEEYPLAAWRPALLRIRDNLDSALERETALTEAWRPKEQTAYLRASFADFWRTTEAMFAEPEAARARASARLTLQPRQEALTALVARLLIDNNEREVTAAAEAEKIHATIARNTYGLFGISVALIAITGLGLIRSNRQAIAQLATLAEDRRSLAQQLISSQESLLRRLSRDLHDEFGQILTAIGALLRRAERHTAEEQLQEEVREVRGIVQDALEKVRSLSQSLQPVILEEQGLLAALGWHVETFSRHTGLPVQATLPQTELPLPVEQAVHLYRIVQEALSNVVRHAGATQVRLILEVMPGQLQLQVEDNGKGLPPQAPSGVGLTAMRERAALLGGTLEMVRAGSGTGVCVQLRMPWPPEGPRANGAGEGPRPGATPGPSVPPASPELTHG